MVDWRKNSCKITAFPAQRAKPAARGLPLQGGYGSGAGNRLHARRRMRARGWKLARVPAARHAGHGGAMRRSGSDPELSKRH